jgi:mono/diheme cytochrome c family protein
MLPFALALGAAAAGEPAVKAPASGDPTGFSSGRQVFEYWCAPCHGAGIGNPGEQYKPGTRALWLKYQGKLPPLLAERGDLAPEFVEYVVRHGVSIMPFFRKTEISDQQLHALAFYLAKQPTGQAPHGRPRQ